ncbi:MAG: hypothetical protein IJV40_09625 [Oscillospiraceae bacterium]|nr:hypothetical protein [Oscillospiraceae bacterium]
MTEKAVKAFQSLKKRRLTASLTQILGRCW